MSVGFICRSVSSCLFLSLTLTSKKFISSFDHFELNLIVGWQALSVSINYFKESYLCSQMKEISLIYLHHMRGCSSMPFKIISSRSVINMIAYGGANLLPIAVSLNCFKVFSLNWMMSFFKTISGSSNKVCHFFSVLASKNFLSEARLSSSVMLG